ncbi:MAG: hypothetical protein U0414_13415 [Polyangiaceae bacterium]
MVSDIAPDSLSAIERGPRSSPASGWRRVPGVRRRRVKVSLALIAIASVVFVVASVGDIKALKSLAGRAMGAFGSFLKNAKGQIEEVVSPEKTAVAAPRAQAEVEAPALPIKVNHGWFEPVPGPGMEWFPSTFETTDGSYDLIIHFHGNPDVVKESVERAHLNAVLVTLNIGLGSGTYEQFFKKPKQYEKLLAAIDEGVRRRGVEHPHLRRVALTSWSAGYGAISSILAMREKTDPLDAILTFDGVHCSWEGGSSAQLGGIITNSAQLTPELVAAHASGLIQTSQLGPFLRAAEDAVAGKIYFGFTHSEIDPMSYASTTRTANYLLEQVGATRAPLDPVADAPPYVELDAMETIVDKKKAQRMVPLTEARKGLFHVIGYQGTTPEHHNAHLFEMSQLLYVELYDRWKN